MVAVLALVGARAGGAGGEGFPSDSFFLGGALVFAASLDFGLLIGGFVLLGSLGGALGLIERFLS